jgi:lysyl-tRNA synthetase class 2
MEIKKYFSILEVKENFEDFLDREVVLEGRVVGVRKMKSSFFVDLLEKGSIIQLFFESFAEIEGEYLNSGDYISIKGSCFLTRTNEPSIFVENVHIINRWKANVGYKELQYLKENALLSFSRNGYHKHLIPYKLRNYIKDFLRSRSFLEVQTPIYCKNFNGGRSFPVKSFYLNKFVAFNRSTMEERMQSLIGEGFERIFQMGSIFRSEKEMTFLEGYVVYLTWEEGKNLIKKLIQKVIIDLQKDNFLQESPVADYLIKKEWADVGFLDGCWNIYGEEILNYINNPEYFLSFLRKKENKNFASLEASADFIAQKIADKYSKPVMVNGFPEWNSPLYLSYRHNNFNLIERTKGFFPGQQGGFDLGVQENDFDKFREKMEEQRKRWGLDENDLRVGDSDLFQVISAGLPRMFGFGINPDRILEFSQKDDCSIDPFK